MQDRQQRVESSQELLEVYNANPEAFHTRLLAGDKTWFHHWDPDTCTKKSPCNGSAHAHPPPKKFRTQPSAGKVMDTGFFLPQRDYIDNCKPAGTSITGEYYDNVIKQLRVAVEE